MSKWRIREAEKVTQGQTSTILRHKIRSNYESLNKCLQNYKSIIGLFLKLGQIGKNEKKKLK